MKGPTERRTSAVSQVYFVFVCVFVFVFRLAAMHDVLLEILAFAQIWDTQCDGIFVLCSFRRTRKLRTCWERRTGLWYSAGVRIALARPRKKYRKQSRKKRRSAGVTTLAKASAGLLLVFLLCYWFMIDR